MVNNTFDPQVSQFDKGVYLNARYGGPPPQVLLSYQDILRTTSLGQLVFHTRQSIKKKRASQNLQGFRVSGFTGPEVTLTLNSIK